MSAAVDDEHAPFTYDYLTPVQIGQLLRPINAQRVGKANGFSHVQGYDVRAHLIRCFGYGNFDIEVKTCQLIFEEPREKGNKTTWTVCYLASVLLRVRTASGKILAHYSDIATGDATNQPSRADAHDMAAKTAATTALKRAAVNLGDQFGLSLYNKGSLAPLVRGTLLERPASESAPVDAHITTELAPEDTPETDEREYSTAPARGPVAVPDEIGAAKAVVEAAFVGATAETDPWLWSIAELESVASVPPAEARARLNHIMEIAVRHRLRGRRLPDSTETLGATLTRRMNQARAAEDTWRPTKDLPWKPTKDLPLPPPEADQG